MHANFVAIRGTFRPADAARKLPQDRLVRQTGGEAEQGTKMLLFAPGTTASLRQTIEKHCGQLNECAPSQRFPDSFRIPVFESF